MMRNDRGLAFVGRTLMALIFLMAGTKKLLAYAATVGAFAKLGIPMPETVVALSILVELGGAVLLTIGYRTAVVATVMALFTLGAALIAHRFWTIADPQMHEAQLNNFMKNVAMVGGFILVIVDARRGRTA